MCKCASVHGCCISWVALNSSRPPRHSHQQPSKLPPACASLAYNNLLNLRLCIIAWPLLHNLQVLHIQFQYKYLVIDPYERAVFLSNALHHIGEIVHWLSVSPSSHRHSIIPFNRRTHYTGWLVDSPQPTPLAVPIEGLRARASERVGG